MNTKHAVALAAFLALCLGAGALGGLATAPHIEGWYATLEKPAWNPPDWVFGPVWTTLFAMMGVAAWLVWRRAGLAGARAAFTLFALQLGLNVGWSYLFFAAQQPGWALVELVGLWLAIAATIAAFARHSRPAAWLLTPYLAWVTFAGVLNATLWHLNAG